MKFITLTNADEKTPIVINFSLVRYMEATRTCTMIWFDENDHEEVTETVEDILRKLPFTWSRQIKD